MATKDKNQGGKFELSRRDFLKVGAAAAAVGAVGVDWVARPSQAEAAAVAATYHTTCPYCSASCGQLVDVDAAGNVLDIYGDHESPWNRGGLCAKGAGAFQLATNPRRIGAWAGAHPVNPVFAYDDTQTDGVAYMRDGDADWSRVPLASAMDDIAVRMMAARGAIDPATGSNSKTVAFFGSSHINNDQCNLYRKIVANFGTSNVEHQARI